MKPVVTDRQTPVIPRMVVAWWRSRLGLRLLAEIALCGLLIVVYRSIRTITRTDLTDAFLNAGHVIRFERRLGLAIEADLQRWLLGSESVIKFLNHYYIWFHFPAAIGLLLWLYLRHPDRYVGFRNLMAIVTFVALVVHLAFPLAPPRMMFGFVDTMRWLGPDIYPANALEGAANQIAAMPSLHFGWAAIEALAVVRVLRTRWRWLILLHPFVMGVAIIGTANHWWLDAAVAGMLIGLVLVAWHGPVAFLRTRRRFGRSEQLVPG